MKTVFSEGPSFFCTFLCNGGGVDLLRGVADRYVSLAMSRPTETTYKLSMSILEFSILLFQSSNCFDLISLFKAFFQCISYCLQKPCSIDAFQVFVVDFSFLKGPENCSDSCFCSFFLWNIQTVFRFKAMFSKGPSFFVLVFVSTFVIVLEKWSFYLDHNCKLTCGASKKANRCLP